MSEVRLVIREANRDWSGTIYGASADRAIAALSADPVTMDELELAMARFEKPSSTHRFFSNLRPGSNAEPYDAGVVVIDLVARLVYVESTYSSPGHEGYVQYHCGQCCTQTSLRYHLADDWQFFRHIESWESVAEKKRKELSEKPTLDARAVFYGKPLLEFVVRQCFAEFPRRKEISAEVRAQWIENARERRAKETKVSPDEVDVSRLTDEEITPKTWPGEERARLPEAMSGRDAMVDPDCPCCQMMGESMGESMGGPWFWHYDGCNNDDEFAFDTSHGTREEWDEAQRRSEEFNRQFNLRMKAERDERERLGVKSSTPDEDGYNAIWSSSFSVGETADVPLGIRVFRIGCHLATLIVGLRGEFDRETTPGETQRQIDQVNRDFGNLRELLQTSDLSLAEALIEPVLNRFAETLTDIESAQPELATECEAVSEDLNNLLGPPPPEPNWDDDFGVPF